MVDFLLKEWLLLASGVGLLLTSVYSKHLPTYSAREFEILFILFVLFVVVKGLQFSGLLARLSFRIQKGKAVSLKLVAVTFFLSMLITNDATLLVVVPLTLTLQVDRRDILVILEALAANAGSALTPFGNPQNLFIYWYYNVPAPSFVETIAPFSVMFLILLLTTSFVVTSKSAAPSFIAKPPVEKSAPVYGALLLLVFLIVLRLLPIWVGLIVVALAVFLDRQTLFVDYALLFTFFFFFGFAENMKFLLASRISHSAHIFLFSALVSQVMSNVPATLLFAKFTSSWKALLWGSNAGGFGSLFGSLANLIAYKMYVSQKKTNDLGVFTVKFLVLGYAAFFLSIGLFFFLRHL